MPDQFLPPLSFSKTWKQLPQQIAICQRPAFKQSSVTSCSCSAGMQSSSCFSCSYPVVECTVPTSRAKTALVTLVASRRHGETVRAHFCIVAVRCQTALKKVGRSETFFVVLFFTEDNVRVQCIAWLTSQFSWRTTRPSNTVECTKSKTN